MAQIISSCRRFMTGPAKPIDTALATNTVDCQRDSVTCHNRPATPPCKASTTPRQSSSNPASLMETNTRLREENERLEKENRELLVSLSSLQQRHASLEQHARYSKESLESANRDRELAMSKLGDVESELDIVKQLLRRYQRVEMQDLSQRRHAALASHRARHVALVGESGDVVVAEPCWSKINDREGMDEIDSGVGMDPPTSPIFLSLPEPTTTSQHSSLGSTHEEEEEEEGVTLDCIDSVDCSRSNTETRSRSNTETRSRSNTEARSSIEVMDEGDCGYDVI